MRDGSPKVVGTSATPVPLTDATSTAEVPVSMPREQGLEGIAAEEGRRIFLRLEGVRGNRLAAGSFLVYLNVPKGAKPADFPDRRVGQLSMFGVRESSRTDESHSGEGLSFSFDITELVRRLQAAGEWQPDRLHVTFAPVPDSVGKVYSGADVQVGRLTVYYV